MTAYTEVLQTAGPLFSLGALMVLGVVCGQIARLLRLPTLTGYLAAGVIAGHHGLDLLSKETLGGSLDLGQMLTDPVNDLAMALVLFVLGGQFRLHRMGAIAKPTITLSLLEAAFTFAVVTLLTWPVLGSLAGAGLLGIMAVAVAPATTLVVLDEYGAEGTTTETLKLLTALSNIWAILAFEIALLILLATHGADTSPMEILWDLGGSLLFGVLAGMTLILLQERTGHGNYSLPLLTVLLLTIGICKATGVPHMLAFLITGAVVANRSRFFDPIVSSMGAYAQPTFVLFFVISGMHLDFGLLAQTSGLLAVSIYVLARLIGKVLGTRLGMQASNLKLASLSGKGSPPIGLGLLCQAGAAIALASYAASYNSELGARLLNIVLGAVIVFELIGPLFVKYVAVAAGEVKLGHLLTHAHRADRTSWRRSLRRVFRGRKFAKEHTPDNIQIERIMRHAPATLKESDDLDAVLHFANHSRFNHFPVISAEGIFRGLISLHDFEDLAYDKRTTHLISAADLMAWLPDDSALPKETSLTQARAFFSKFPGNTCAVVDPTQGNKLVGMLERSEVLHVSRKLSTEPASLN